MKYEFSVLTVGQEFYFCGMRFIKLETDDAYNCDTRQTQSFAPDTLVQLITLQELI